MYGTSIAGLPPQTQGVFWQDVDVWGTHGDYDEFDCS